MGGKRIYLTEAQFNALLEQQLLEENFNSILMFFSYPNGTEFEIDISPYIYNADEYISSNNIFWSLQL